jgi:WD40 repeat protein
MPHRRTSLVILILIPILALLTTAPWPFPAVRTAAQDGPNFRFRAPVCNLSGVRLTCSAGRSFSRRINNDDQRVVDFTVSADGRWVAYRTEAGQVVLAHIYSESKASIDNDAFAPANLEANKASITWAPDGVGLAYVTAWGFSLALPLPDGTARLIKMSDRLYTDLRFSPGGARLAAGDMRGGWTIFTLSATAGIRDTLTWTGIVNTSASLAWLDDNSLIIAPQAGGLLRTNVVGAGAETRLETAWNSPSGRYIDLTSTSAGPVRALLTGLDPAVGVPVEIQGDGSVAALSTSALDARAVWMANGQYLVYITNGTPIVIEPMTGLEDALSLQSVSRFAWAGAETLEASSLQLDADVYFLQPDDDDVSQVWRLSGSGSSPIAQVSRLTTDVLDFAVSPDGQSLAITSGGRLFTAPIQELSAGADATPTPAFRAATPQPFGVEGIPGSYLLATIRRDGGAQPAWRADGRQVAFVDSDGIYLVSVTGQVEAPPTMQIAPHVADGELSHPQFSPDRGVLLLEGPLAGDGTRPFSVTPVLPDSPVPAGTPFNGLDAVWGLSALFSVQRPDLATWTLVAADASGTRELVRSPWPIESVVPLGGASGLDGQSVFFLRNVGWAFGPTVVQLCLSTGDPNVPEVRSAPMILERAALSPAGTFAAGLASDDDGTMDRLVILDLQNGRRVAIRDADGIRDLRWVR